MISAAESLARCISVPLIALQPSNQSFCEGKAVTFNAAATGTPPPLVRWQLSTDGGASWSDIPGQTSGDVSFVGTGAMNGNKYRAVFSSLCGIVPTNAALLTVSTPPHVTDQPVQITVCAGADTIFSIAAGGSGLAYQWQVNPGTGFVNVVNGSVYSGASTSALAIKGVPYSLNGNRYRCLVSGICAPSDTSVAALLTVGVLPKILSKPRNDTICLGDNAVFSVSASGSVLNFRWQEDQGSGFTDLVDNTPYSGSESASLTLTDPSLALNGASYRCIVSGFCSPPDTSTAALLLLLTPPLITSQPADARICEGQDAGFTVSAKGEGLSYRWQEDNGSGFADIANGSQYSGVNTAQLVITNAGAGSSGAQYRCIVSGVCSPAAVSATVALVVIAQPVAAITPDGPLHLCSGGSLVLKAGAGPGWTYQWMLNGGMLPGETGSQVIVTQSGDYRVIVTNGGDCSDTSDVVSVTRGTLPAANILASGPTEFCEHGSVLLTMKNSAGLSCSWTRDGMAIPAANDSVYIVRQTGVYRVIATNASGCSDTSGGMAVIVHPLPSARIIGPSSLCPNSIAVYALDSNRRYDAMWSVTGGTVLTSLHADSIRIRWSGLGSGIVQVAVTDTATGCRKDTSMTVLIAGSLAPLITSDKTAILCDGESVTLEAGRYVSYTWSTGDSSRTITVRQSGIFTVEVKDATGCNGTSKPFSVQVNKRPIATISPSGAITICPGDSVQLTAGMNFSTYFWSNGASTQAISVRDSGAYSVIVTDANGCTGRSSPTIVRLNDKPVVEISGQKAVCIQSETDYSVGQITGATYAWTVIGGSILAGAGTAQIRINWTSQGFGLITIKMTLPGGCVADTTLIVMVQTTLQPKIAIDGTTTMCEGDVRTLDAGTGYSEYLWSTGDTTKSIAVRQTGAFSVSVKDAQGCSGRSDTVNIVVNPLPDVTITGPTVVCIGDLAWYYLPDGPSRTIIWKTRFSTVTSNDHQLGFTWWGAGVDSIRVTIITPEGCSKSDSIVVLIGTTLQPVITANRPTRLCEGDTLILNAESGYGKYSWSNGEKTQSIAVTKAGVYSVLVTSTAGGCTGSSQPVTVTVEALPNPVITGALTICGGDSTTLDAGSGYSEYLWSTGDSTRFIVVKQAGDYTVRVRTAAGCEGTSPAVRVVVVQAQKPTVIQIDSVLTSSAAQQYQWLRNDTIIPGATAQRFIPHIEGHYTVRITDQNGCHADSYPVDVAFGDASATVAIACLTPNVFSAGDIISIPLMLSSSSNLKGAQTKYRAQLRFRRSVLSPMFAYQSSRFVNNERIVSLSLTRPTGLTSGTLLELPFMVLLGDTACVIVHLDSLRWLDDTTQVRLQNQDCQICVNVCREGGARLFSSGGKVQLFQNQPNPFNAQTVIRYELIETGPTSLTVSDMLGRRMATLVDETKDAGIYEARFDATTFSSGVYFSVLRTPTMTLSRVMSVVK